MRRRGSRLVGFSVMLRVLISTLELVHATRKMKMGKEGGRGRWGGELVVGAYAVIEGEDEG
jgi:hypothetical protein